MTAVFLDRDGVIIRKAPEGDYISRWDEVQFLPDAVESAATLYRAGYKLIIVTNQRGIATGKIRLDDLEEIHQRMRARFSAQGAAIAGVYFCPHDLAENCPCRKPKPGMILQAAEEHGINLAGSWMVGDAASDVAAGKSAGCRTVWIVPNSGGRESGPEADILADGLPSAARQILRWAQPGTNGHGG